MPLPPLRPKDAAHLAKESSYSLTLSLSSTLSWASCSRMRFTMVASLSPTVDA